MHCIRCGQDARAPNSKEPKARASFLKDVLLPLCEQCGKRPARMSVTRTSQDGQEHTQSLCATCARMAGGFLFGSLLGMAAGFPVDDDDDLDEHIAEAPFEAIMDFCFARDDENEAEQMNDEWEDADWMSDNDPFEDESLPVSGEDINEVGEDESNLLRSMEAQGEEGGAICGGCGATWDKIASDERAGCAKCYSTFRASLTHLLEQVQREAKHFGKAPRAAQKRRLRLEHLRRRRDNQLAMLRNRLAQAVKFERYEEAATLRDKIKVVSSSLF